VHAITNARVPRATLTEDDSKGLIMQITAYDVVRHEVYVQLQILIVNQYRMDLSHLHHDRYNL
jgi:arginyl-tRNA synthetase